MIVKTPIFDFVNNYCQRNAVRLHMPGHKGLGLLGCENIDITEIAGADSLFEADGIIRESEKNAGKLFCAHTFYSTEGSSLAIRAMLYLIKMYAQQKNEVPMILAGRNVHKSFLSGVSLLDMDVEWLYPSNANSYLSCIITPNHLKSVIKAMHRKPTAVYVTSPDYLGNILDIRGLATVCHQLGILLIVDNAHGAYLKFLARSKHPIDLGADICCDSAHKTLPVLTGGSYLHVSANAPKVFRDRAKDALMLFGSTSPSYLILQSLDLANRYISNDYRIQLKKFICKVEDLKEKLKKIGFSILDSEPLKITIRTKNCGYSGKKFAQLLNDKNIVCEFCDPDYVVLMLTPETGVSGLVLLEDALMSIPFKTPIRTSPPLIPKMEKVISVKEAMFSDVVTVSAKESRDRVLATPSVSCPPAIPIAVPGEKLSAGAIKAFDYYGIKYIKVIK